MYDIDRAMPEYALLARKYNLSNMVQRGMIERASRGVYVLPHIVGDELYSIKNEALDFFYVKPELLPLGMIKVLSLHGKLIQTYDIERTIGDIVGSKSRMDMQIFTEALKGYSKRKDKDLSLLMKYARTFKIEKKMNSI